MDLNKKSTWLILLFTLISQIFSPVYSQNICPLPFKGDDLSIDELRYNEVQFKAGANPSSVDALLKYLSFAPDEPWQGACQGIELSLVQNPLRVSSEEKWHFVVQESGEFDRSSPDLKDFLREIQLWSERHPGHHVLTIHLNLKKNTTFGEDALFSDKLDELIISELPIEKIYTPSFLQGDEATPMEGVNKHGWPTMKELRNSFIIVLSGDDSKRLVARRRLIYTYTQPYKRLAFVDMDQRPITYGPKNLSDLITPFRQQGMRVFINLKIGPFNWVRLAQQARELNFVTRLWTINNRREWAQAKGANVNIMTTNQIQNVRWTALIPSSSPLENGEDVEAVASQDEQ